MCTVAQIKIDNRYLVAKNHDTFFRKGMIFTNHKGIKKTALISQPYEAVKWISKYGSLSFCQCGKELPVGGINQKGLVVEETTLIESVYPNRIDKPAINELQLIQYLLDTCSNVQEAVHEIEKCNIAQASSTIQYIISDRQGDIVIVEFLKGKANIFTDVGIITNSTYKDSLRFNEKCLIKEVETNEYQRNSLKRYIKARYLIETTNFIKEDDIFMLLKKVEREDTLWNIIYDSHNKCISYKIKGKDIVNQVYLNDIDFSKSSSPMYIDLTEVNDKEKKLELFSVEVNRRLIESFFNNAKMTQMMKLSVIPEELFNYLCEYPDLLYKA